MPSLTFFSQRFTPSWLNILSSSLFILLFLRLGFWQIERAETKKAMIDAEWKASSKEPIEWKVKHKDPQQYQKIKLKGHFLPRVFLLDNQHHQHQFGYNVLSPLLIAKDEIVLIDRGWVPGDPSRLRFPHFKAIKKSLHLLGSVYFPSQNRWILGESVEEKNRDVTLIENIDTKRLSQILHKKVYPFIMRLDKHDANGFVREWAIVSMPFQRHLAYAFQWFAMALVILILFLALNRKKNDDT